MAIYNDLFMVDLGFLPQSENGLGNSDQVMIGTLFVGFWFIVSKYTKRNNCYYRIYVMGGPGFIRCVSGGSME